MKGARSIFIGKYLRTSLFWMGLAFLIGGCPLVVYFTQPGAPAANLVVAAGLGIPPFAFSIFYVLKYRALVLLHAERRLVFVEGVFLWRKVCVLPFESISEVRLLISLGDNPECRVEVVPRAGAPMALEERSCESADDQVRAIASAIGVRGVHGDRVVYLPAPRPEAFRRNP